MHEKSPSMQIINRHLRVRQNMYLLISVDVIQTSVDGTLSQMTAFYMKCCPCHLHHVI